MLGFTPLAKAPLATEKQEVLSDVSVNLTGVSSTSAIGTASASIPISIPITGVGSTSHVGGITVLLEITVPLAG